MNEQPQHDFVFGINIPVNVPTEQEVEALRGSLENHLTQLIESGYMTVEEAIAYVKFSTHLASFVPFMMDGFLASYRSNMEKRARQMEADAIPERKIVTE